MLKNILDLIVEDRSSIVARDKGVAFLAAARPIYQLEHLHYFCANIQRRSSGCFVHCAFGDDFASQAVTRQPIHDDKLQDVDIVQHANDQANQSAIMLTPRCNELVVLGFTRSPAELDQEYAEALPLSELKILGDYFHSHILRRNGVDTADALVVSARELDCLRWIAAGKSAWEASVILGISERTVRFHLNSAREKLNCTTTTQAVAKVVSQQLIII
jgi:DNA-binding CsgD family transcriptional regulator